MSEIGVRHVSFAGTAVSVQYDGEPAKRIVDYLYGDVPAVPVAESDVFLSVCTRAPDKLTLVHEDKYVYEGDSPGALANLLIGETIYHLADRSSGGCVLHAGAVSRNGIGMILPGSTGAGKTTLTAWLIRAGLNYLTDELVYVEDGSDCLHSFTRPLNVKAPAFPCCATILMWTWTKLKCLVAPKRL